MIIPSLSRARDTLPSGQGSLDYLLLIAGAILVVTVVLLIIFTSVIPTAEQILQNNLSRAGQSQTLPGSSNTNNPPPYSGPLSMDWSRVQQVHYDSFQIDNTASSGTADPLKTMSSVRVVNMSPPGSGVMTLTSVKPIFWITSPSSNLRYPLPSSISSLSVYSSSGASLGSLTDLYSNTEYALSGNPGNISLSPGEYVDLTITFNQSFLPVEGQSSLYPAPHEFSFRLEWKDSLSMVHRPEKWNHFLVYEKTGSIAGSLDSFVQTCDGGSDPVGGTYVVAHVTTDSCVPTASTCSYVRDMGYATVFAFPSPIPASPIDLHASFFMTQIGSIVSGVGTVSDADPYYLIDSPSCDDSIFDNVIDTGNPAGTSSLLQPDTTNTVYAFDATHLILGGDDDVSFNVVGSDSPSSTYTEDSLGYRQWQTGYHPGQTTPTPFLFVNYVQSS